MGQKYSTEEDKKQKVQIVAQSYYSRIEIQNAIYNFCKHRETVPRYLDGFGKRPDVLDYPSDIFALVKKGATSFHCSEEIWKNPLEINTDMTPKQYNEIKQGWDFLIDIDSKYFDYSKIAAELIIKALEFNGVKNIGVKFSGSKGFHILVPFEAFPQEVNGELTKDQFPEWPRYIASYIFDSIKDPMNEAIFKMTNREELERKKEIITEHKCPQCIGPAIEKKVNRYVCPNFRCRSEVTSMKSNRKTMICPSCNGNMEKVSEEIIYFCENCKINTAKLANSSSKIGGEERGTETQFIIEETTKSQQDSVDIVLVSSRHLFRAPYSLHEKTSFVSVVIDKDRIKDFKPSDADPLKVKVESFHPVAEENEAEELLLQALDWAKKKDKVEKKFTGKSIDLEGLTISEDMFPPVIKKLMNGINGDGRKRALSILISFFASLNFPKEYLYEKLGEWNKKNYKPLKEGYIRSQIEWGMKNKRLPPNYDKPIYKELGVFSETAGVKNPINFTIREALIAKARSGKKGTWSASVRVNKNQDPPKKKDFTI